jgi:hypothetical protein
VTGDVHVTRARARVWSVSDRGRSRGRGRAPPRRARGHPVPAWPARSACRPRSPWRSRPGTPAPSRCHSARSFAGAMLRAFAVVSMCLASSSSVTARPSTSAIASSRSCPRTSSVAAGLILSRRSSVRPAAPRSGFMPSIWRRRWYCISIERATNDDATGIWFFLISSRNEPSRASRSMTSRSRSSSSLRSAARNPSSVSALPVSLANSSSSSGTSLARASRMVSVSWALRPRTDSSL